MASMAIFAWRAVLRRSCERASPCQARPWDGFAALAISLVPSWRVESAGNRTQAITLWRGCACESKQIRIIVSVGLNTLTAISRTSIGVEGAAEALRMPWRATYAHSNALASVCNLAFMAGGERYVQRETLKSFGLSRGRCSTPGCRSVTGIGKVAEHDLFPGLEQPALREKTP